MLHVYICNTIIGLLMIKTLSHCPVGHLLCSFFLFIYGRHHSNCSIVALGFCRLGPGMFLQVANYKTSGQSLCTDLSPYTVFKTYGVKLAVCSKSTVQG